nr:MAG TPA: hypothetical protein [Caudoviricetes sp.]
MRTCPLVWISRPRFSGQQSQPLTHCRSGWTA